MTDINKLEELATWLSTPGLDVDGEAFREAYREDWKEFLEMTSPSSILSLISKYRRMEEALKAHDVARQSLKDQPK